MADEAQNTNASQQIVENIKNAMEEVSEKLINAANAVKLKVSGLSTSSTIESLRAYFEKFGTVDNVEIQKCESVEEDADADVVSSFAVIVFGSKEIAENVLAQEEPHVVDGVQVEAKLAEIEVIVIDDDEEVVEPTKCSGFTEEVEPQPMKCSGFTGGDDVVDAVDEEANKPEVIECKPEGGENVAAEEGEQLVASDPQKLIMASPTEEKPFFVEGEAKQEGEEVVDVPEVKVEGETTSEEQVVEGGATEENQGAEEEKSEESQAGAEEEAASTE